jgi:hypothetical protein
MKTSSAINFEIKSRHPQIILLNKSASLPCHYYGWHILDCDEEIISTADNFLLIEEFPKNRHPTS